MNLDLKCMSVEERSVTLVVVDLVIQEILLAVVVLSAIGLIALSSSGEASLDTVKPFDIVVSLVFECRPVKRLDHLFGGFVITETVGDSLPDIICNIGRVPMGASAQ